jgi:ketosteroid isomerase-like protein
MKHIVQTLLPAAIAGLLMCSTQTLLGQTSQAATDEQTLIQMEKDWSAALLKRDMAVLDRMEAPEYTFTSPDGSVSGKADSDAEIKNGIAVIESFTIDELKVQLFGDTAVVHGLETEKSNYRGKDTSGQYRFTDVFIKRNGTWRAVATHSSKVMKH